MRPLSLFVSGLALVAVLACGGSSSTETTSTSSQSSSSAPAQTLPEPWGSMSLPIGTGEVVDATVESVLVAYPSESLITLTNTWTDSLIKNGYTKSQDVSQPGITAIIFAKGPQQVGLATGQEEGVNFAYVEDLGKVSSSVVRGQRKAGMKPRGAGGRGPGGGGPGGGPREGKNK